MLENSLIRRFLYANTFLWICVLFTIVTIFDMVLTVAITGDFHGTDYFHLGTRLIICTFVSLSLWIFRIFYKLPFWIIICTHFLSVILFSALYVWITGFFMEQHPQAMFYMIRSILMIYPLIGVGCIAFDYLLKKHKKNKIGGK
jgi:hypothetical protein